MRIFFERFVIYDVRIYWGGRTLLAALLWTSVGQTRRHVLFCKIDHRNKSGDYRYTGRDLAPLGDDALFAIFTQTETDASRSVEFRVVVARCELDGNKPVPQVQIKLGRGIDIS